MANSRYENNKIQKLKDGRRVFRTRLYPDIPKSDKDIYIVTQTGDRMDALANQFYGDVTLYWIIAAGNPNIVGFSSLFLKEGIQLRIPVDINEIISSFNRLNSK